MGQRTAPHISPRVISPVQPCSSYICHYFPYPTSMGEPVPSALASPLVPLPSLQKPRAKLDLLKLDPSHFASSNGSFHVQSQVPWPKLQAQSPSRCSIVARQHIQIAVCSCHMIIVAKETSPLASQDTARPRQPCVTWGPTKNSLSHVPDKWVPRRL